MAAAQIQQTMQAMRQEMDQLRVQLQAISDDNVALRQAHLTLEQNTAAVLQVQMANAEAVEKRLTGLLHAQKMDLLNLKNYKPEAFSGKNGEAWKPWAKKMKLFLNA